MKQLSFILIALLLYACGKDESIVTEVLETTSRGAVVRTIDLHSGEFNSFDTGSSFSATVEVQGTSEAAMLDRLEAHMSFGSTSVLVKTFQAAQFSDGPFGYPRVTVSITLAEALEALSVSSAAVGGKSVPVELKLYLTDGRVFDASSSSGSLQGSFFSSPFRYNTVVKCIPDGAVAGTYRINMIDSYGDGWQGSYVKVTVDGQVTNYGLMSSNSEDAERNAILAPLSGGATFGGSGGQLIAGYTSFTIPSTAKQMKFEFIAGDWPGEVSFNITHLSSDGQSTQTALSDGPNPSEGEKILSICL